MEGNRPTALLIGESPQGYSYLAKRLQERGCDCEFATTWQEAESRLQARNFDVVLSPARLRGHGMLALSTQLDQCGTTLFYSYAVEDGCWWLPAIRSGKNCFGSSALQPSELISALDETIARIAPARSV